LTDIGIEPYVSASALIGVIAQRLMRRLCMHCRRPYTPDAETLRAMSVTEMEAATLTFYRAVGCDQCNHTGYRGRVGIYEIMHVSDKLRRMIAQRGSEAQLRDAAVSGGMVSLGEDGLLKVKAGVTTPDELLRVVTEVRETRSLCPQCGAGVSAEFAACPSCGHRVGGGCPHCGKPLQSGWKFCPYCAKSAEGTPSRRPRKLSDQRPRRELPAATNVAEFKK
jgi:type IV pilus assembly protein PilB